jgi:hypothetical protein
MERIRIQRVGQQSETSLASMRPTQMVSVIGALDGWEPAQRHQPAFRRLEDERGLLLETAVADLEALERFPSSREGSNLRDVIGLALRAGAPLVHVVLHDRQTGEEAHRLLSSIYDQFPLALIVFADLSLWASRRDDWHVEAGRSLLAWKETLRENHQVGLFDLPPIRVDRWGRPSAPEGLAEAIQDIYWTCDGVDVAAFTWVGDPHGLRRHGWRSAAAVAAGLLAKTDGGAPTARLLDREVVLPGGRYGTLSRAYELDPRPWSVELPAALRPLVNPVKLGDDGATATFDGQVLLRPDWEIPAHRTLRFLHHSLYQAAQDFVFRPANQLEAITLAERLRDSTQLLVANDLLVGPTPEGGPAVSAWVEETPNGMSMVAEIAAQLRPWGKDIDLKFRLGGGIIEQGVI